MSIKYYDIYIYIYNFEKFTALEEISKSCFISLPTTYTWRHKIMTWLQFHSDGFKQLEGLIEIDSTYFNKSFKGQRNYFREDYDDKYYGKFIKKKHGISSQKLCVTTVIDRNKHIFCHYVCNGKANIKQLHKIWERFLKVGNISKK